MPDRREIGQQYFRAQFDVNTINKDKRTVEIVFATEREVMMYNWQTGLVREVLVCDNSAGDLSRLNNGAPLLDTHRKYSVKTDGLGVVEKAWFENGKGRATVRFSKRADVESVWQDVQDGMITGISVGYNVYQYETTEEVGKLPLYRATKWEATEISMALVQADADSSVGRNQSDQQKHQVEIISTNSNKSNMKHSEILQLVRAAGLGIEFAEKLFAIENISADTVRSMIDAEKTKTAPPANQQQPPAPVADPSAENTRAANKAATKATSEILNAVRAAGFDIAYAEELMNIEGMTPDKARTAIIAKLADGTDKPTRAGTATVNSADGEARFRNEAATGMILRSGQVTADKFKPEEVAASRNFQQSSLLRFAAMCLQRAGVDISAMSDFQIAQRAITTSGSDFPVVLENVMHKILLAQYGIVPDTWRRFCKVGSVSDFRVHNRYRPGSLTRLDEVKENGELKNKALVDATKESIQAKTFGNIININRQTIINDDLNYFSSLAADFGRAAARGIEQDVYALLALNSGAGPTMTDGITLFHASHGNVITGAVPSVASFDAVKVALANQKDYAGNDYLDLSPSILLLNTSQSAAADAINDSLYDPDASNKLQKKNTSYKTYKDIVATPRVGTTNQYSFADPSIAAVLEVAFLNGIQTPYLERHDSFEQLGTHWRMYFDYGVGAIDWKGAVRNPGA